jgi:hypothetical protein
MIHHELSHTGEKDIQIRALSTDQILPSLVFFQKGVTIQQIHVVIFSGKHQLVWKDIGSAPDGTSQMYTLSGPLSDTATLACPESVKDASIEVVFDRQIQGSVSYIYLVHSYPFRAV